jgi:Phosphatidylethanolamine-binding protein
MNLVVDYGEEGSGKTMGDDFLVYRGNFLKPTESRVSSSFCFVFFFCFLLCFFLLFGLLLMYESCSRVLSMCNACLGSVCLLALLLISSCLCALLLCPTLGRCFVWLCFCMSPVYVVARATPRVHFEGKPGTKWTLMLVDPDAPTRANPVLGEWCHWMVTDIPSSGEISEGSEVIEYIGPAPPKNSGSHRYVYLLCLQHGNITPPARLAASRYGVGAAF